MSDLTTPTHGKFGAIYRLRPNGFKGDGLNDVTWGAAFAGAASGDFEVVIDGVGTGTAGVDTFKWRTNGGAWNETVDITGASQDLGADGQTITFAATKGHTEDDQWSIGNLKAEPTTESGTTAQITEVTHRLLNPDATLVWTDSGGAVVEWVDWSSGTAHFNKNVATVTVAGNNGYVLASGLQKLGYLLSWNMTATLDLADTTAMGDEWKTSLPGQVGGSGGSEGFFIGNASLLDEILAAASVAQKTCLLQLFTYDPDQDQTGSHFNVWVNFTGMGMNTAIGEVIKESANFQFHGKPSYVVNA
jgi:hypothetical protein